MRKVNMRKRRTGWCSMGGGSYNSPNVKDDAESDADDSDDDDSDDGDQSKKPKRSRQQLSAEAARRRREAREWRQRAEAAEAKLASDGKSTGASDGLRSDLILELADAGLKKDQIRAAMKLVDLDDYDNAEDAIEDLREQYPSVFTSEAQSTKTGPTAPRMNNGRNKPNRETQDQKAARLAQRFPALGRRYQ